MSANKRPYYSSSGNQNMEYGVPIKQKSASKRNRWSKPSLPKNKSFVYVFLVVCIIGTSIWLGWHITSNTTINDIRIHGASLVNPDIVLNTANVPLGVSKDSVNFIQIINQVERISYVESATVYVSPSGRLDINITERKPLAILLQGNEMVFIDKEGVKMQIPEGVSPNLPLLYGFDIRPLNRPIVKQEFKYVADFLIELNKEFIRDFTISEVGWHATDGVIALTRRHGVRLTFGKGNYDEKLFKWQEFYRAEATARGLSSFTSLDFRFKNQIVAIES